MALVRVNRNLHAELTGSLSDRGKLERALGAVADQIAQRARAIARGEYYATGAYARSIRAEHGVTERGDLVGRVVADDWKAHWAEFPPRQQRGRQGHILTRAAEQVGLEVAATASRSSGGGPPRRRPRRPTTTSRRRTGARR